MKRILVIGAGRSAITLIKYLFDNAEVNNWQVTVADFSEDLAKDARSLANHLCLEGYQPRFRKQRNFRMKIGLKLNSI